MLEGLWLVAKPLLTLGAVWGAVVFCGVLADLWMDRRS